nr:MAG TPA: translocation protein [Caudoviricetes sp.]DAS83555.1 MAG TPA: translocation protein [Caudoviricetes sp.]
MLMIWLKVLKNNKTNHSNNKREALWQIYNY